MRPQHLIVRERRALALGQNPVDLTVVIQQVEFLLGYFFAREIVDPHLDLRWETREAGGARWELAEGDADGGYYARGHGFDGGDDGAWVSRLIRFNLNFWSWKKKQGGLLGVLKR